MAPRRKSRSNNPAGSSTATRTETVAGRVQVNLSPTAGGLPAVIGLTPQFTATMLQGTGSQAGGAKLAAMSDLFQFFRFTKLVVKFRELLNAGVFTAGLTQFGYAPDSVQGFPATSNEVTDLPWTADSVATSTVATVPSVPRSEIIDSKVLNRSNVKWWRTRPSGAVDDQFEYQGILAATPNGGANPLVLVYDIEYVCQFKDFVAAGQTPMVRNNMPICEEKSSPRSWTSVASPALAANIPRSNDDAQRSRDNRPSAVPMRFPQARP